MRRRPPATVLTPNLPEAARLLGARTAASRAAMEEQARALLALGPDAALVKGGHLDGHESPDLLATPDGARWYEHERGDTQNTHGTGRTLSAALAAWPFIFIPNKPAFSSLPKWDRLGWRAALWCPSIF